MKNLKVLMSSKCSEWETPFTLFHALDAEFHFTLDVCATAANRKCRNYFSPRQNGLKQRWKGICWMNPPYGREIVHWMRKAYEESQQGIRVVCLIPARTDTGWWHDYVMRAKEIRYIRGRIKFIGGKYSAPFPSAIAVF